MKKYFMMFAAAVFAFAACENEPETPPEPPVDSSEISIAPETVTFAPEGGSQQVLVTSSDGWTLSPEETYDWISADIESGVDGDIVTFKADPNSTGSQRVAEYTFTCGDATAIFTAISQSSDPETFSLASDPEVELTYAKQRITVDVTTTLNYRTITSTLPEGVDWITPNAVLEADGGATMYFDIAENAGEETREAVITIAEETGEFNPFTVTVSQRPEPYITVEKAEYFLALDDTGLEIPVSANVGYDVTVSESWLTYSGTADGVNTFKMSTATEQRSAVVTFTEKNPIEGVDPVTATVTVTQREAALVQYAINMSDARIYPDGESWKSTSELKTMGTLTLEALIRPDNFDKGGSGTVSTVMGIEGTFLVRIGDAGVPNNQIQIATASGNYTDASLKLNTGEWYHLAVTYDRSAREICVYLNGELAHKFTSTYSGFVTFAADRSGNEMGSYVTRLFWVGYSYEPVRDFEGLMAEVRIWNKVLTEQDIKAENHFYTVDPSSDGLVAYWKCNDGSGTTVKDYSHNGNDLTGQYGLYQAGAGSAVYTTGETRINWVEVALP